MKVLPCLPVPRVKKKRMMMMRTLVCVKKKKKKKTDDNAMPISVADMRD